MLVAKITSVASYLDYLTYDYNINTVAQLIFVLLPSGYWFDNW